MRKLIAARRFSQAFFLALFIYAVWSTMHPRRGIFWAGAFFQIDPYMTVLMAISHRVLMPGFIIGFIMLGLTLVFGRFYCGWMCPLGTVIDYVGALKIKRGTLSDASNSRLRKGKFVILGITAVLALAGIQAGWMLDPMVIAERFLSMNLIPAMTGAEIRYSYYAGVMLAMFLAICIASVFLSRAWCRVACPLGALYALAGKAALLERHVKGCVPCGRCKAACRMGAIKDDTGYIKSECILCMDCVYECRARKTVFSFAGPRGRTDQRSDEYRVSRIVPGPDTRYSIHDTIMYSKRFTYICILLSAAMSLTSCATTYNRATGRKEMRLIDIKQEERIGESIHSEILANYPKSGKPVNGERVLRAGNRLVSSIDRRGIAYKFGVVRDENMNAFTIPGGYVYVTTGLLENISTDDELAAVMAHEIGHSEARHAVKRLEAALSYTTVMQMAYMFDMREEDKKGYWKYLKSGTDVIFSLMTLGYSRKDEYEADWLSIRYMRDAGYDPNAIITLMEKLKAKEAAGSAKWMYFLRSHPYLDERMEAVRRELARDEGGNNAER